MIQFLRYLLLPFTGVYIVITAVRNLLYDLGVFKSTSFNIPVISIGNLMVGGTGKTPVTEYLVNMLSDKKIAILSRGYGRKTKGFILADAASDAHMIGDEPMQYFSKFPDVTVAVCEDRVEGIKRLQMEHDLILLDDAFQHRAVKPGLSVLLFDFSSFFSFQCPFPTGNMRETWSGYERADVIVITKVEGTLTAEIVRNIQARFPSKPVYFSKVKYGSIKPWNKQIATQIVPSQTKFILITGIAKPKPLLNYLSNIGQVLKHFDFPDHYQFTVKDLQDFAQYFKSLEGQDVVFVTTEKDIQRLNSTETRELLLTLPMYYIPIEIQILEAEQAFVNQIKTYVSGN